MLTRKFSRREVIKMSGAAAVAALVAACQPKVVEVEKIVEREVTKIVKEVVKETVIIEGTPVTIEKEVTKVVQVEVTKAPAEKVVIEWATPAGLGLERTMYTNFSYKFMEENPGIKVKMSFEAWGDYMTKLPTMMAAGMTPEVIHQHYSIAQEWANLGVLLDIVPFMDRDDVRPEDFIQVLLDIFRHEDKIFGLPKDSAVRAVYINKTLFEEAGVDCPALDWTVDDFEQTVLLLTRDKNGYPANDPKFDASNVKHWGFAWANPSPVELTLSPMVWAQGGRWYNEDFTEHFPTDPAVIDVMRMIIDLRCKYHAIPSPSEALGQGDQWRAGLVAMAVGHHSTTFFAKQEKVRFEYDCMPEPSGPAGQYAALGCSGFCVSKNAPHKDEGWQLLNFLTSEETQAFIGQQKRWGVQRPAIVHVIEPDDGIPEHFAYCHTDPFKPGSVSPLIPGRAVFPPRASRIKEIWNTELDSLWTCGEGNLEAAAARCKEQVDKELSEIEW